MLLNVNQIDRYCDVLKQFLVMYLNNFKLHLDNFVVININCLFLFVNLMYEKKFFSLKMLRIWNSLPESIVSSNVMIAFKRRICKFDLSDYLRLNEC